MLFFSQAKGLIYEKERERERERMCVIEPGTRYWDVRGKKPQSRKKQFHDVSSLRDNFNPVFNLRVVQMGVDPADECARRP